jgi:hypothetical protein
MFPSCADKKVQPLPIMFGQAKRKPYCGWPGTARKAFSVSPADFSGAGIWRRIDTGGLSEGFSVHQDV